MSKTSGEKLVPKRIGGVKVPKKVRKAADAFAALLTTPEARKIAADILIAAADVLAASGRPGEANAPSRGKSKGRSAPSKAAPGPGVADTAAKATGAVVDVVSEAARHILPAARTGEDRESEEFDRAGETGKRKKNRERPSSH